MQLEHHVSALHRGQSAALIAYCARRAPLPIAQIVQKSDPGLEPAGNLVNVGLGHKKIMIGTVVIAMPLEP
jgi:hypothetical protein